MKPVKCSAFKRFWVALKTVAKISCVVLALCAPALAHKASDAYLQLGPDDSQVALASSAALRIGLKLSLALRDLDAAIDTLDVDNNRQLEWGEIRQNMPAIQSWVTQGLHMRCAGDSLSLAWSFESLEQRSDGVYVRLASFITCSQAQLGLHYQLMQHIDATHRLIIGGTLLGTSVAALASPQNKPDVILQIPLGPASSTSAQSGWSAFAQFFPEGIHHLATGYDHLAFLLALLLPITLRQSPSLKPDAASTTAYSAQPGRPGVWDLMRTVTGFTLGHSITLFLASMGWIASPAWVEPAIAVTIGLSALLNLYPVRWVRSDALALGFGLVHGLGFSSIMREANVSGSLLPWALAGFNLGVEAGQLVGVALWCGVHLVLVRWQRYEQVVVRGGSWALLALAIYWAVQRLALG